jgi:predicted nucleic acid-binding protein
VRVQDALKDVLYLYIETAPFIYFVENHPVYADKVDAVFAYMEANNIETNTSAITLTEILVKPPPANDNALQDEYLHLLTTTDNVHLMPVNATIAKRAALLRARYKLKTPDAIHVATALKTGCNAFLKNDVGIIGDLVPPLKIVRAILIFDLHVNILTFAQA